MGKGSKTIVNGTIDNSERQSLMPALSTSKYMDRRWRPSFTAYSLIGLALAISIIALWQGRRQSLKIGYLRSNELVFGYSGMKEAQNLYRARQQKWQAELDSLQSDYQKALGAYNSQYQTFTVKERSEREAFLTKQEEGLTNRRSELEERSRAEDQKMTQGVLSQINTLTQQYGKENGYSLILATTQSGSILYGDNAIDLTSEILQLLNKSYSAPSYHVDTASKH